MLIFLTSAEEVHAFLGIVSELLVDSHTATKMKLLPLYANLSLDKQLEVFKQPPPGVSTKSSHFRKNYCSYKYR